MSLNRLRGLSVDSVRRRFADERRDREIASFTARSLTPPPPSAFAAFGAGSVILPPARVLMPEAIEIGTNVVIHEHAWIAVVAAVPGFTPKLTIGDEALIDRMVHIACVGEVEIGAAAGIGERTLIGDSYHRYDDVTTPVRYQPMAEPRKVTIGPGAHLGLGCIVLPGVTIGQQAFIGAGAVVTRDVPPRTVAVGNPARVVRHYDETISDWVDSARS